MFSLRAIQEGAGLHREAVDQIPIMLYELGGISRSVVYGGHTTDEREKRAYLQSARIELADLITQCRIMAEHLSADFQDLIKDGEERFVERMEEVRQGII